MVTANPASQIPITNPQIPPGGPRTIPVSLIFGGGISAYTVDLSQNQNLAQVAFIQGVYVDNSNNSQALLILCASTNQVVQVPANNQGYFPLLAGEVPKFAVSSTGTATVPLYFYNVPIAPTLWGPSGSVTVTGMNFDGGGNLKTADQALDAIISAGGLNVNVISGGGSSAHSSGLIVNTQLTSNAGVNSALSGALNRWYVTSVDINLSADCALAAAANGNVHIWAAGGITVFAECYFRLGTVGPGVAECIYSHDFAFPVPGDQLNDRVQAQMSFAALSAGNVNINVWGYAAP